MMDLTKLFETQRILDERIEKEHPRLPGEERLSKMVLALLVELAECANEWRGFKFWSTNQKPRLKATKQGVTKSGVPARHFVEYNPLLEEYVDCLHLILSIGLEYELKAIDLAHLGYGREDSIELQFIMVNILLTEIYLTPKEHVRNDFRECFKLFIGLGQMLGFTWEQIETAYYSKNEINHTRQDEGY